MTDSIEKWILERQYRCHDIYRKGEYKGTICLCKDVTEEEFSDIVEDFLNKQ